MELVDLLGILKKRWVVIVAITALTIVGVLFFSVVQKPVYEAKATSMVIATLTGESQYSAVEIIQQLLETINKIAVSRPVLEDASNRLKRRVSANQFQNAIRSQVITNTQLIVTAAKDENPTMAMRKANAAADSLISFINQKEGNDGPYKIEKVEPALSPKSPISPKPIRNGIIGFFPGLILGVVCAALLEYLDVSVKSGEELGQLLNLPVLGEIPLSSDGSMGPGPMGDTGELGILEQTRTLRTNIQYMDINANLRTILITSSSLREGKTFISNQLSRAFAASGKNVILVDADLRKLDHYHGREGPGLTDVIMGAAYIKTIMQSMGMKKLWLLPSGPLPPNPSELLGSTAMESILDSLRTHFDIVIIDSCPIGMFSDPLVLASKVDGIVLVAEARSTSRESLKAATEMLTGPKLNLLGTVLNKVSLSKSHLDSYDYYRSK